MCENDTIENRSTFTELNSGSGGSIMDETKIIYPIGPGSTELRHRARIVIGGENLEQLASITDQNPEGCEYALITRAIPYVNNIYPIFNSVSDVVLNNTNILTYTVTTGKTFNLTGFSVSGDLPVRYKLTIQDYSLEKTYFTYRTNASNLNGMVNFNIPIGNILEGYVVRIIGTLISAYNGSPPAANYEATILGFETADN